MIRTFTLLLSAFFFAEILCGQAQAGGGVGDGGQGVVDLSTGLLRFADVMNREELNAMKKMKNPDRWLMNQYPPCTHTTANHLSVEYESARTELWEFLNQESELLGKLRPWFESAWHFNFRYETALHLRQARDAESVGADYQVQLAIFGDNVSFFQTQALLNLFPPDRKWLLLKEMLRHIARSREVIIRNGDFEEALRFISKRDKESFHSSNFYLSLTREGLPPFSSRSNVESHSSALSLNHLVVTYGFIPPWAFQGKVLNNQIFDYTKWKKKSFTTLHGFDVWSGEERLFLSDQCMP